MRTLTDEQKEQMWEHIKEALLSPPKPKKGEFTMKMMMEYTGCGRNKLRNEIKKLMESEVIGARKVKNTNIYFPLKEMSVEELISVLSNIQSTS
jgi:predicted transcriptional regulator